VFLGLSAVIWIVLVVYFAGMLLIGWWCRRMADSQEGYLVGNRRFGVGMMVMHAFGAGTNPGDAAGVVSKTVAGGASGIWVSWMWMFGTPFYWLIAPIIRRLRCLTMADFFEQRFGKAASVLYVIVASAGMVVCLASVLLATTRTVQGMMGKADVPTAEYWFFGILTVMTVTFMLYGYWGGIVAAVRTDMIQGIMIIVLSFLAVPAALKLTTVGGMAGIRETMANLTAARGSDYSSLFDPRSFSLGTVILLCVKAPLTALALPHLVTVCGAGRTAWEGRVGFACGNMLKRICTIGWSILGLAWLTHLVRSGAAINPDAAFGDSIRMLLPPVLQGMMLSCVMAAAMSSGDAFQVTVAGLFSQNIYRRFINPEAGDKKVLEITKVGGVIIVLLSLVVAAMMRASMVAVILDYFSIMALAGISVAMGVLWRRMNSAGMIACTLTATAVFVEARYWLHCPLAATVGMPIAFGVAAGILASLLTRPPDRGQVERFFVKIYTPIGREDELDRPLEEAVPPARRLLTAGGMFVPKPTAQSWVGFTAILGVCIACVLVMLGLMG